MSCSSPPPPLELLDEYWFFSNTLVTNNSAKKKPPHPRSPSPSTAAGTGTGTGTGEKPASGSAGPPSRLGGRRLLRTPSLPTSRVGMTMELPLPLPLPTNKDDDDDQNGAGAGAAAASASANQQAQRRLQAQAAVDEVDDDDLNWSSIYEGVLRTRMAEGGGSRSALRRAPSMPTATEHHHGDERRQTKSTPSMPRLLRHSHSTLGRHTPPTKLQQAEQRMPSAVAPRCSKKQTSGGGGGLGQQDKKWKSSSDLESIEVQGFRDLGFVFDKEELRDSLADVLPGLKHKHKHKQQQTNSKNTSTSTSPRRPYLSEAWHQVRRPALARVQSAAEMKDQLRMWAQAVACNVRQEC